MSALIPYFAAFFLGAICAIFYMEWEQSRNDDDGFGGGLMP